MDLSKYEGKHVRIRDIYGSVFTGIAGYGNYEFLMHEYGGDEDGIFIEDCLVYNSQIASIEEITVHGTAELWTERMTLRRYCPEDAEFLAAEIRKRVQVKDILISTIGCVVGSHTGPGTVALFFWGDERTE